MISLDLSVVLVLLVSGSAKSSESQAFRLSLLSPVVFICAVLVFQPALQLWLESRLSSTVAVSLAEPQSEELEVDIIEGIDYRLNFRIENRTDDEMQILGCTVDWCPIRASIPEGAIRLSPHETRTVEISLNRHRTKDEALRESMISDVKKGLANTRVPSDVKVGIWTSAGNSSVVSQVVVRTKPSASYVSLSGL